MPDHWPCSWIVITALTIAFINTVNSEYTDPWAWAALPAVGVCLWILIRTVSMLLTQTRSVTIDSETLSIGGRKWYWGDIIECNLDTTRLFGMPGRRRDNTQVAVLVFNAPEEVRIFYPYYTEKQQLLQHLQEAVEAVKPAAIKHPVLSGSGHTLSCPRCLGKTYVTQEDIERIGHGDIWTPGDCTRCNGTRHIEFTK